MMGVQIYKIWNKIGSKRNKKRLWIFLINHIPQRCDYIILNASPALVNTSFILGKLLLPIP